MTNEEALAILKDFMENPDDYFAKKYPFIPMKFYSSVEVAIEALAMPVLNKKQQLVFDWAQEQLAELDQMSVFIENLGFLSSTGGKMKYGEAGYAYEELSDSEIRELLYAIVIRLRERESLVLFSDNQKVLLNYIETLPEKSLTAIMSYLSGLVLADFSIPEAHMDVVQAYEALTTQEVLQVISKVV